MPILVQNQAEKLPIFILVDQTVRLPAADLFVQGVEQLLPRRRSGEGRALEQRPAEPPLIAEPLRRAVKRNPQPIEQIHDLRTPIAHLLHRRLMLQEVAAVDRVVKVQMLAVPFLPRQWVDRVDPPWAQTLCDRFTGTMLTR